MAEQFKYSSVLAPYMNHLLDIKISAGISALRTRWILKEIDDFANAECLKDPHIKEVFFKSGELHVWRTVTELYIPNVPYGVN